MLTREEEDKKIASAMLFQALVSRELWGEFAEDGTAARAVKEIRELKLRAKRPWDSKHLKYLWYVLRHKYYVVVECHKAGILWRGLVHDLSKFSPVEWVPYVVHFYGDGKNKEAFDTAWLRHQHRNPHHWQYWVLREDSGKLVALDMPEKYRIEMLCDWRGAGKAISGIDDTKTWYLKNRAKMDLHDNTRAWVEAQLEVENKYCDIKKVFATD